MPVSPAVFSPLRVYSKTLATLLVGMIAACSHAPVVNQHGPIFHAQAPNQAHFAMIGDFGRTGPAAAAVAAQVLSWRPEFIVTLGDNNYPRGAAETFDDAIAQYYAPFIKFGPGYTGRFGAVGSPEQRFFPALGNHDWYTAEASAHLTSFDLPGNGRYYRFTRGPVEFFVLDSDPHEPDGVRAEETQGRWLKAALAASEAPWKLVILHHPPFSRGHHGSSPWVQWPFAEWGAHAAFAGHDHSFQRLVIDEFPYVVMGLSGAERDICGPPSQVPRARWSTCFDAAWGALEAWATPTALTLAFVTSDGAEIDRWTLSAEQPTGAGPAGPAEAAPKPRAPGLNEAPTSSPAAYRRAPAASRPG